MNDKERYPHAPTFREVADLISRGRELSWTTGSRVEFVLADSPLADDDCAWTAVIEFRRRPPE